MPAKFFFSNAMTDFHVNLDAFRCKSLLRRIIRREFKIEYVWSRFKILPAFVYSLVSKDRNSNYSTIILRISEDEYQ